MKYLFRTLVVISALYGVLILISSPENLKAKDTTSKVKNGRQVLTEKDFRWNKDNAPYKSLIVKGVNKIRRENDRCKRLHYKHVYVSKTQGTKKNPAFYVHCQSGFEIASKAFTVFFSKSDILRSKRNTPPKYMNKKRAVRACKRRAKGLPKDWLAKFSRFVSTKTERHSDGNTTVFLVATSKNEIGVEAKFYLRCRFDSTKLVEAGDF